MQVAGHTGLSRQAGVPVTLLPPPAGVRKTAGTRPQRLSPNGAVLNASVDTALASTVRPKVRAAPCQAGLEPCDTCRYPLLGCTQRTS
jgi:hypothetical protein